MTPFERAQKAVKLACDSNLSVIECVVLAMEEQIKDYKAKVLKFLTDPNVKYSGKLDQLVQAIERDEHLDQQVAFSDILSVAEWATSQLEVNEDEHCPVCGQEDVHARDCRLMLAQQMIAEQKKGKK